MKSLPRTPCQNTASTSTATMMAKAFQNNHHKRGLAEMMAPPPTPTGPQSNSYLDCQSLQSSLKRVRLSSSPGELRLQRDLRHMVSSGSWITKQQDQQQTSSQNETLVWHPPAPPVTARPPTNPQQTLHIELQQVESLRLRLTFQHSVVAWIQIPRMYPHRPPLISRIVYNHHNNDSNINSNAGIQSILVHEAPPNRGTGESTAEQEDNNSHDAIQCANTVVYRTWSPVQRLGDLLDFVIQVFQKQHQEMNFSTHSRGTQQFQSINDVSLTYSSSSLSSNSSWSRRSSNSSITSATTSGYRTSTGTVFPGWIHPAQTNGDMSTFLTPNRFDMGYDRAIPPMTMDVDGAAAHQQVGIPQQVSMMDL